MPTPTLHPTLATWQRVLADQALLRRAADCDPTDVASISRLRKHHPADQTLVALELLKARRKAQAKFPDHAPQLIADVAGIEQATSYAAASYKAKRFRDAGLDRVADLCCGIGGDAIGFADAGLDVLALDRDPVRTWMASQNAHCPSQTTDAESFHQPAAALHLDPARRTDAGRVFRLADYQPGPATIRRLLATHPDAAIKLSPAIKLDELDKEILSHSESKANPSFLEDDDLSTKNSFAIFDGDSETPCPPNSGEVEFISEAGRLVQAVLWTGRLARHPRAATLITSDGQTHTLAGSPDQPAFASPQRYLFAVDPSVERAGLMGQLGLPAIHPKLGLLTSDQLHPSPWLTTFELLAELPFRPKKIKAWLAQHDGGIVEIKTRGKAADPDALQKQLRGTGQTPYAVFVLRFDQQIKTLITQRISTSH